MLLFDECVDGVHNGQCRYDAEIRQYLIVVAELDEDSHVDISLRTLPFVRMLAPSLLLHPRSEHKYSL